MIELTTDQIITIMCVYVIIIAVMIIGMVFYVKGGDE